MSIMSVASCNSCSAFWPWPARAAGGDASQPVAIPQASASEKSDVQPGSSTDEFDLTLSWNGSSAASGVALRPFSLLNSLLVLGVPPKTKAQLHAKPAKESANTTKPAMEMLFDCRMVAEVRSIINNCIIACPRVW